MSSSAAPAVMEYVSRSFGETVEHGRSFAAYLRGGEALLLSGVLGSGKTAFTKGVALGLAVEETVTSPSFSILNIYRGRINLYHFDFYRLEHVEEMEEILEDYLYRQDGVCAVEWGDALSDRLAVYYRLKFRISEEQRIITVGRIGF